MKATAIEIPEIMGLGEFYWPRCRVHPDQPQGQDGQRNFIGECWECVRLAHEAMFGEQRKTRKPRTSIPDWLRDATPAVRRAMLGD